MTPQLLKLKVMAGSREESLTARAGDSYLINVKAPAKDGRANAAALALLAKHLGVAAAKLWIIKGAHAPSKIVKVHR